MTFPAPAAPPKPKGGRTTGGRIDKFTGLPKEI